MGEEGKETWTLSEIRKAFDLRIVQIAKAAHLESQVIYAATIGRPILREQAEQIRVCLPQLTHRKWKPEQILFVLWEDCEILWVVRASSRKGLPDYYQIIYAKNEERARQTVARWLASLPSHSIHVFTPYHLGFVIGEVTIPGYR